MYGLRYNGWSISGSGEHWQALRFGVRMRGNSQELIRRMIDLRGPNLPR